MLRRDHGRHDAGKKLVEWQGSTGSAKTLTAIEAAAEELKNWIRTGGDGEDWNGDRWHCPDWYPVIRAARYLAVPAWRLVEKRTRRRVSRDWWLLWAMISETAELQAQAAAQKEAAARAKRR